MDGWWTCTFSAEQILKLQNARQKKNNLFNYSNLKKTTDTRWVGDAGELAFEKLLEYRELEYTYWAQENKIDDRDFTVGKWEIDVKTISTNVEPKPHYSAWVLEDQYKKLTAPGNIINMLVFCRYVIPENKLIMLGFMKKADFIKTAKYIPAGSRDDTITLSTGHYAVAISDLSTFKSPS